MIRRIAEAVAAIAVLGVGIEAGGCSAQRADSARGPMDQLKKRLYSLDQDTSGLALAELIKLGPKATGVLLEALTHDNARTRRLAAEGLGEIADSSAAEALFRATSDPNDEVRARAAAALHAVGDGRGLSALVATINDYPDLLHSPNTASMYPLMQGGRPVLPLITPLLSSIDELTRQRGFLVLRSVVSQLPEGKDWDGLWRSLGRYDPLGPATARAGAAGQWKSWVAGH